MSRLYKVEVLTTEITEKELLDLMVDKLGWEEDYADDNCFVGKGSLYGGKSEEEAHEEIYKELKKLNSKAKIQTRWTYLEDLPYETYGDEIEW